MNHRAKKSMGQNFLKSEAIVEKIIEASDLTKSDTVLEIGPGMGVLTGKLAFLCKKVVAVEKDDGLFAELSSQFQESSHIKLIHGDILKYEPKDIGASYKIVANIPYNITGAIIEKFLSTSFQPSMMVLMVQKEVAERIVAKNKKTGGPGKESILSIAIKAYGTPEYVCTVKAGNFIPAPSVDSAVIKISNISRGNFHNNHHEEVFFQLVKAGFAHKRKTLAGNLKNVIEPALAEQALSAADKALTVRAEDLRIHDWFTIANIVYNSQYGI